VTVAAEHVVIAAGMLVAARSAHGAGLPGRFRRRSIIYLITEQIDGLSRDSAAARRPAQLVLLP